MAYRRIGDDRKEFLLERIGRVVRVLKYQENDAPEYVQKCFSEVITRFDLSSISLEPLVVQANEKLSEALRSERDNIAIDLIFEFINENVYARDSAQ